MQLSFWIWLAAAVLGGVLHWLWLARAGRLARNSAAPRESRVFETAQSSVSTREMEREEARDFGAWAALSWPILLAIAGFALAVFPSGASGGFDFEAHRAVWWNWTAGLFYGALLGGAARFWAPRNAVAALLGLGALGAAMALFAGVEATRGARIEALLGLASGWILARQDDESPLISLAAILAGLALLRDVRAGGDNWSLTAGIAAMAALMAMAGALLAARWRGFWIAIVVFAGAFALHWNGESAAALVALSGAFCGVIWAWHARQNAADSEAPLPILAALALALGANTILQGFGVALGALMAGATLWTLGERSFLPRVAALGAVLAIYRLIEARQTELRSVLFGDFAALWALGAAATLIFAATSPRLSSAWRPLLTPAILWSGLAALLILWGPRAASGALAGCVAAVIFGSTRAARGAVLAALWLGAWISPGLEFSDAPRATRIAVLVAIALLGALGAALWNWKMERKTS